MRADEFVFSGIELAPLDLITPPKEARVWFLNPNLPNLRWLLHSNFTTFQRAWGLRAAAEWCEKMGKPWQHTRSRLGRRT